MSANERLVPLRRAASTLGWRPAAVLAVWFGLAAAVAVGLGASQHSNRRNVEDRFDQRAAVAARFVDTYVTGVVDAERAQAERHLSHARVTAKQFDRVSVDGAFGASVLLDSKGRLLQVYPREPELLGTDMTAEYAHLAAAVNGRVAISEVVPSAARGVPIVAFAVPFETPQGQRVYSGAQDVGSTPAGAYLRNAVTTPGARLYLVDGAGSIIASNRREAVGVRTLADVEPTRLAERAGRDGAGTVDGQRFTSASIDGTPWRVVVAVPTAMLYRSTSGVSRWLPWILLIAFAVMSLFAAGLLLRLSRGRAHLSALNDRLEEIVRIDPLTGLYNRRGLDERLEAAISAARRHRQPLGVLLLDIDHFKRVNDTHGHQAGDAVLAALGQGVRDVFRTEDVIGRWGGEEFMAILPNTDAAATVALAERLRATIARLPIELPGGGLVSITVSIGATAGVDEAVDERLREADAALYLAKLNGRDRVGVHTAEPIAI